MEIDRPEQLSAHLEYVKINVQDVGHNPGYEPLFRAAEQDVKNVKLNDLSCLYTSHLAYHWTPISSSQSVVKRWLSMSRRIAHLGFCGIRPMRTAPRPSFWLIWSMTLRFIAPEDVGIQAIPELVTIVVSNLWENAVTCTPICVRPDQSIAFQLTTRWHST